MIIPMRAGWATCYDWGYCLKDTSIPKPTGPCGICYVNAPTSCVSIPPMYSAYKTSWCVIPLCRQYENQQWQTQRQGQCQKWQSVFGLGLYGGGPVCHPL